MANDRHLRRRYVVVKLAQTKRFTSRFETTAPFVQNQAQLDMVWKLLGLWQVVR